MEPTILTAGAIGGGLYIGKSLTRVPPGEMAEVTLMDKHHTTLGPGWPYFYAWGFYKIYRFPTIQIPLTLRVPVPSAEAERAEFYDDRGRKRTFSNLPETERRAIIDSPLSHRSLIVVEVTVIYEFVEKELYDLLVTVGPEKVGERLGIVVRNGTEGLFARITIDTALERKDILSPLFNERIRTLARGNGTRPIGLNIVQSFIGPVELDPEVAKAQTSIPVAFAKKKEIITLAEGEKQARILRGEAQATLVASMGKEMLTEEGKLAANNEYSREILKGAERIIIAPPGLPSAMAMAGQVLGNTK